MRLSSYERLQSGICEPISTSSQSAIDEASAASNRVYLLPGADDLTTEEHERRIRFLAYVRAHARSYRVAQLAAAERENAKRKKKKRPVSRKKHRSSSSTKASRM